MTIIGAVSLKMKIIFHHVTYSTNIETVENFFKKLDKKSMHIYNFKYEFDRTKIYNKLH